MLKCKPSMMAKLLAVLLTVSFWGCAAAYHDYQSCCIPYLYCTPPPLPYADYEGCHCPTPGALQYFQQQGSPADLTPESDIPAGASEPK